MKKKWLLGLLSMLAAPSLHAQSVIGIRADGSEQGFPIEQVVSVKVREDDKMVMNSKDGARNTGFEVLKFKNEQTASLGGAVSDNSIRIYPNPVKNTLYIVGATDETQITIVDANGKTVLNGRGASIEVNALAKGLYILSAEGKKVKFIKE